MLIKVIIAGGRNFDDYDMLKVYCDRLLSKFKDVQIISGTARGVDILGERYAREREYHIMRFPPDWKSHGRAAGPIRNRKMAEYADALIAFWDGKSKGTKNMIDEAKSKGLKIKVIEYES